MANFTNRVVCLKAHQLTASLHSFLSATPTFQNPIIKLRTVPNPHHNLFYFPIITRMSQTWKKNNFSLIVTYNYQGMFLGGYHCGEM